MATKNDEELALCFYSAMFRADDVMETLYSELIEMKEIEMTKDEEVVFSDFSKKIFLSIASIKLKKIINVYEDNKNKGTDAKNIIVEKNNSCIKTKKPSLEKITFNGLLQELRVLFRNTDIIDVIIEALINIGCIDISGCRSEKANLLLTTILSNKVKSLIIKKADVESF
jgi:valyl-tRNA synthetase